LLALLLSGCAGPETSAKVQVVAGLYPLAFVAEQVGGDRIEVTNLTPPAGHAHELELTARQVARVTEADLVLYIAGLQPALDEAVALAPDSVRAVDALALVPNPPAPQDEAHEEDDGHGHAEEGDPHLWLDPQ
jgi:zinc transport system substrate-binding protein